MIKKKSSNKLEKFSGIMVGKKAYGSPNKLESLKKKEGTITMRKKIDDHIISPEDLAASKDVLIETLSKNKIPASITETYINIISLMPAQTAYKFILKEAESLKSNKSLLQGSQRSLKAWTDSLETIKDMSTYYNSIPEWAKNAKLVKQCAETLMSHILITISMTESIKGWKDHMKSSLPELSIHIDYIYNALDVFYDLKSSCDFLLQSSLSCLFPLTTSDPFLKGIVKAISKPNRGNNKSKGLSKWIIEENKAYLLLKKELVDKIHQMHDYVIHSLDLYTDKDPRPNVANPDLLLDFSMNTAHKTAEGTISEMHINESSRNINRMYISSIIDYIIRNDIEILITELRLDLLCEETLNEIIREKSKVIKNPEFQRRMTLILKNVESDKFADLVYNDLIEEFIYQNWMEQLAVNSLGFTKQLSRINSLKIDTKDTLYQNIEDFVLEVFTPGVALTKSILT